MNALSTSIVLASASPRRVQLMTDAHFEFSVIAADIDETPEPGEAPLEYAERLATAKAEVVANSLPTPEPGTRQLVIGADTIVVIDNAIVGKPTDEADAEATLMRLSGRAHEVVTAIAVIQRLPDGTSHTRANLCRTDVRFRELSPTEIEAYVATGESLDKAGSYAIQGRGGQFVDRIDGPYDNVVGLPIDLVRKLLRQVDPDRRPIR